MKNFEDLKILMLKTMQNRQLPKDVIIQIEKIEQKVNNIYNYHNANNSTISEYINANFNVLKNTIEKLNSNRKDQQLTELAYLLNGIERKLEEDSKETKENQSLEEKEQEEQEEKRYNEQNKESISQINMNSRKMASIIIQQLQDCIKDVKNLGNRSLSTRGINPSTLEEINYDIRKLIYNLDSRESEQLLNTLEKDDTEALNKLITCYEEYELLDEKEKTKREKFAEELNAGISLEEQAKSAKMKTNKGLAELLFDGEITEEEYNEARNKLESENKSNKTDNELAFEDLPDDVIK